MAYRTDTARFGGSGTLVIDALDEEFDPLEVDDADIDQEWMDDLNPYDTIDYPTMRNMPESVHHDPVYSPSRQGSATAALRALLEQNPNRRPVLLSILALCEGGCAASVVAEKVAEWQEENWSVYGPMTLCRMLETAGALELTMPPVSSEQTAPEDGVAYLVISESIDPVWTTTEEAAQLRRDYDSTERMHRTLEQEGEAVYAQVYLAVLRALEESPRSMDEIERICADFPITAKPKRYGQHFIDVLESRGCAYWKNHAWAVTPIGEQFAEELAGAVTEAERS